ncbi:FkbM family methyltransferase [Hymenobacter bucti]|uniref:FkbM family methyltransferase n=1 Tax=Hymenobacter bucti TaxID=1844114 RepID=A0ABW4QRG6_9BACT
MLRALLTSPFQVLRLAWVAHRSRYRGREQWEVFRVLTACWLKINFAPRRGLYRQRIFGFVVEGSSYELLLKLFKEMFLVEPYAFEPATTTPTIIDGGANIGMAVVYFKKHFPEATILAFEPSPEAFRLLTTNVANNQLRNVQLYNVALAPTAGELPFYLEADGAGLNGSLRPHPAGARTVHVPARRLSDYLGSTARISLLKLDVEGAEAGILADLDQDGLLSCCQQVIVEYHYPIGSAESAQLAACLQTFERRQFAYYFKVVYPRTVHSQDVILHCWQRP